MQYLESATKAVRDELDAHAVTQVYSGSPGCACGCQGNYSNAKGSKTRVVNGLLKMLDEENISILVEPGVFVSVENDRRTRTAYFDDRGEF